jgi:D-alanyl-D-alanine carboxypeptidase
MSRQWARKKYGSNSSMPVQKSSSWQRPFSDRIYDVPAPKQTASVQAKRRNVDWSRVTVEAQSPAVVEPLVQRQPATQTPVAQTEWDTHRNIKARYKTWQTYETVRSQVASWGVNSPANYIEAAIGEWNANSSIHGYFGNNFDGDPHRSYLNLKRLYQARGINNPGNYIATNIVNITFFNRTTQGHKDLQAALNAAQTALTSAGHTFVLEVGTWSFVPRTFNNNINKLSNHALGRAIDINPKNNPQIASADEILVINAICSSILTSGLLAETDFDNLQKASDRFQKNFNNTWVTQQEELLKDLEKQKPNPTELSTQKKLVKAIKNSRPALNKYAANGFLNLPKALVEELQKAGLNWGGTWNSAKDFMHFELSNP